MPRNADRIVRHLTGQRASISSSRPGSSHSYRPSFYVYPPSGVAHNNATSGYSNGVICRIPITLTNKRIDPNSMQLSTICDSVEENSQSSNTPHIHGSERRHMLASLDEFDTCDNESLKSNRRISIQEGRDGDVEIVVENEEPVIFTVFENLDGIRHLFSDSIATRYTWMFLIAFFVCLCFYQIVTQIIMFWYTPIATNIAATYPRSVPFPVVAVCNNNQYRLTYLTGDFVQNRIPRIQSNVENTTNVFDKALLSTWDLKATKFLQSAGHSRYRMILKCQWPNGTRCKAADFRPLWTLNGLCWAINTDPQNPVHVTGGGSGNALKLLLNIERYERIKSCTPNFRTTSLPGLKILIFNQSDLPTSNLEGVNVPPGFTMDIPFRVQQRQKLPGKDCVEEPLQEDGNMLSFDDPQNARSCIIRTYLTSIESECKCSLRDAFNGSIRDVPPCSVISYFNCAVKVLRLAYENGFRSFDCLPTCKQTDYTAWQDMNELPDNIFPKIIESSNYYNDDSNENEINTINGSNILSTDNDYEELNVEQEHFKCELNQILDDLLIKRIKRDARNAYEKQARFQEDILLRTQRLINHLQQSVIKLRTLQWGWLNDQFIGVQERLQRDVFCYSHLSAENSDYFSTIKNIQMWSEEQRVQKLLPLLLQHSNLQNETNINIKEMTNSNVSVPLSLNLIRKRFGLKAGKLINDSINVVEFLTRSIRIFDGSIYTHKLSRDLDQMERMLQWIEAYEKDQLKRRIWAERMQSRNMRHLFNEEFYESWYNLIVKDLDVNVLDNILRMEELIIGNQKVLTDSQMNVGSMFLFSNSSSAHLTKFRHFFDDLVKCLTVDVRNASNNMLIEFKSAMHDFRSAYEILFLKELPEYLQNFEFGEKFVRENFAQVNVFLHKMNIEDWIQQPTYSIYSLFCDVGGTLGLFLNASLLTLIEIVYFVFDSKIYRKIFCCNRNSSTTTNSFQNKGEKKPIKSSSKIRNDTVEKKIEEI